MRGRCWSKCYDSILQNGEQKVYVFQQNSPSHSAARRKRYLHHKTTGMRAPNKICDMKSNDSNLDLQQTKGKFLLSYTDKKNFIPKRSLIARLEVSDGRLQK